MGSSPEVQAQPIATLDRYELIAEIARGGMGTVFLARLQGAGGFQRLFAIKMMHAHLADDQQFVAMLLDEARVAARIHHPNAVGIMDVCESKRGWYLVMEYIEGFTLAHLIDHPSILEKDRIRYAMRAIVDACNGLHAAHEATGPDGKPLGIVHRDVSPQNILVGVDGTARIADFGVARAAARITSSRPGMIKGKPCYMAPEQAKGEDLDRRADVFAMGIVLWEALTGARLFFSEAGDAAMLVRVMFDDVPLPSSRHNDVPKALDEVCIKALARDLPQRYKSAREMAFALEKAASSTGMLASSHEMADAMEQLFADEIRERRDVLSRHMAHLGRGSHSAVASDVFDVPRLSRPPGTKVGAPEGSDPPPPPSAEGETRTSKPQPSKPGRKPGEAWAETPTLPASDAAVALTAPALSTPIPPKAPVVTAAVGTLPVGSTSDAPKAAATATATTAPHPKARIGMIAGVVLAVIGLAVIGWVIVSSQGDDEDAAAAAATATDPATATATATDPATDTDEQPGTGTGTGAGTVADTDEQPGTGTGAGTTPDPTIQTPGLGVVPPVGVDLPLVGTPPTKTPGKRPPRVRPGQQPGGPTVEQNPYL